MSEKLVIPRIDNSSNHNSKRLPCTVSIVIHSFPALNQFRRLLLLSYKPSGFACVKRKERLPTGEWAKNESHEMTTATTTAIGNIKVPALFQFIHFQL